MRFRILQSCCLGLLAAVAALSGGCSILESVPLDAGNPSECRAAGGIYFLPRREIKVTVSQAENGAFALGLSDNGAVPDRDYPFCLDFLGSAASDDKVIVLRNNGLLTKVSANASDRSLEIAESVVNTALVGITGNPNAALRAARVRDGAKIEVADFIFDPFDRQRLAHINESLGLFGYCIFIDGHTLGALSDDAVQQYCNRPSVHHERFYKAPIVSGALGGIQPNFGGIAYRANASRAFYVMRRRDPGSRSPWLLHANQVMEMPNESPVFSIAVDRSAFVTRDTDLTFDNGVLTNVTIAKPSEALAAAGFSLRLAQALIDVPAQIVRVRIQAVNNRKALIDAQNQLIFTQARYSAAVQGVRSGAEGAAVQRSIGTETSRSVPNPSRLNLTRSAEPAEATLDCQFGCAGGPDEVAACRAKC